MPQSTVTTSIPSTIDDWQAWREPLFQICQKAGQAILAYYQSNEVKVESKADDSPVTQADKKAHRIIVEGLQQLSSIPFMSEEGILPTLSERAQWSHYWLVDPLDGTKEFLGKTDEFTVNIALVEQDKPIAGMVYVPVSGLTYFGGKNMGAWMRSDRAEGSDKEWRPIHATRPALSPSEKIHIVASRRHHSDKLKTMLTILEDKGYQYELVNMGSSLKICLLAEGKADWYPRLAPTSEWDTAAAQAVLEGAGGVIVDEQFKPMVYNRKESLLNPFFHCFAQQSLPQDQSEAGIVAFWQHLLEA